MTPQRVFVGRLLRLRRNTHWPEYASFDSLISRAGLGNFGKGWIVRDTTTTGLTGSSTPSWNKLLRFTADCLVALWPTAKH